MAIATVEELKEEARFGNDLANLDDAMMQRHLDAAQEVLQASLGFSFAAEYPEGTPPPAAIKQAVLWLALDYYDGAGRVEKGNALPAHVENIVANFREWSF